MKREEFGKWLESWVEKRKGITIETMDVPQAKQAKRVILTSPTGGNRLSFLAPDAPYNLYDDKEWLTISWGLIR